MLIKLNINRKKKINLAPTIEYTLLYLIHNYLYYYCYFVFILLASVHKGLFIHTDSYIRSIYA